MNFVKSIVIAMVVALVAALMGTKANAQSPSATPTAGGTNFPGNVPEGWKAEGWSQSDWMALYKQCLNIPAETTRRAHMTPEQLRGLKPIPGDWEGCKHIFSAVGPRPTAGSPQATNLAITPTPMSTPLPPALPVGPQSLEPDTSDPPATGQSFAGGGASACQSPPAPNVGAQTPPLDVAADVSSTQNVEMRRNPAVDHYLEARSDVAQCRNNLAQTLHFHLLAALPFDFDRNSGVNYR
jgi:hypothetical protein